MERVDQKLERLAPRPGIAKLILTVASLEGAHCVGCGVAICGHEAVVSVVLGFQKSPRCIACFARGLERDLEEMKLDLLGQIERRPCYGAAWALVTEGERHSTVCRWEKGGGGG